MLFFFIFRTSGARSGCLLKISFKILLLYIFRCQSVSKFLFPLTDTMDKLEHLKFLGWMKQNRPCHSFVRTSPTGHGSSTTFMSPLKLHWTICSALLTMDHDMPILHKIFSFHFLWDLSLALMRPQIDWNDIWWPPSFLVC